MCDFIMKLKKKNKYYCKLKQENKRKAANGWEVVSFWFQFKVGWYWICFVQFDCKTFSFATMVSSFFRSFITCKMADATHSLDFFWYFRPIFIQIKCISLYMIFSRNYWFLFIIGRVETVFFIETRIPYLGDWEKSENILCCISIRKNGLKHVYK